MSEYNARKLLNISLYLWHEKDFKHVGVKTALNSFIVLLNQFSLVNNYEWFLTYEQRLTFGRKINIVIRFFLSFIDKNKRAITKMV